MEATQLTLLGFELSEHEPKQPSRLCHRGHAGHWKYINDGTNRYWTCNKCQRLKERERYNKDPAKYRAKTRKQYWADPEKGREAARLARAAETPEQNANRLEKSRIRARKWRKDNPQHRTALTTLHKKIVKLRTPPWADIAAIKEFYKNCPPGFHVDHVIPLRGKFVSGLHVVDNLQYLPALDNIRKKNRWVPMEQEIGVV